MRTCACTCMRVHMSKPIHVYMGTKCLLICIHEYELKYACERDLMAAYMYKCIHECVHMHKHTNVRVSIYESLHVPKYTSALKSMHPLRLIASIVHANLCAFAHAAASVLRQKLKVSSQMN